MKTDERRHGGRLAIILRNRCSQKACPNGVINADFQGGPSDRINVDSRANCVNLGGNSFDNHRCYFHALRSANWSSGRISKSSVTTVSSIRDRQSSQQMVRMMMLATPSFRACLLNRKYYVYYARLYTILPFERDEFRNHGVSMMSMQERLCKAILINMQMSVICITFMTATLLITDTYVIFLSQTDDLSG